MAFDEQLADRVRSLLHDRPHYSERKMFGGLCFMLGGNMCCGIVKDELMVRLGPQLYEDALQRPGARSMDFTGKPMKGMLYVQSDIVADDKNLAEWVELCASFAGSLPLKEK